MFSVNYLFYFFYIFNLLNFALNFLIKTFFDLRVEFRVDKLLIQRLLLFQDKKRS